MAKQGRVVRAARLSKYMTGLGVRPEQQRAVLERGFKKGGRVKPKKK